MGEPNPYAHSGTTKFLRVNNSTLDGQDSSNQTQYLLSNSKIKDINCTQLEMSKEAHRIRGRINKLNQKIKNYNGVLQNSYRHQSQARTYDSQISSRDPTMTKRTGSTSPPKIPKEGEYSAAVTFREANGVEEEDVLAMG